MKIVLKILNYFFVFLGVIFFIILIGLAYIFFADPFGVRPFLDSVGVTPGEAINFMKDGGPSFMGGGMIGGDFGGPGGMMMGGDFDGMMGEGGFDSSNIPPQITQEVEDCFLEKLGAERIKEIAESGAPSPLDILKAGSCFK